MECKYLVVIGKTEDGSCSANAPDLPRLVSCTETVEAQEHLIKEVVDIYVQDTFADGHPATEGKGKKNHQSHQRHRRKKSLTKEDIIK